MKTKHILILPILIFLVLVSPLFTKTVYADDAPHLCNVSDFTYKLDDNYYDSANDKWVHENIVRLGKYIGSATNIIVPSIMYIEDNTPRKVIISGTFYGNSTVKKLAFQKGVILLTNDIAFSEIENLESIDLNGLDCSHINSFQKLFMDCKKLKEVKAEGINTSTITSLRYTFFRCQSLQTLDLNSWDVSNVTDFTDTFSECNGLTNLYIDKWNTSSAETFDSFFHSCENLKNVDVSNFETSKVTNLSEMFYCCESLESLDLRKWNVSNVKQFHGTFAVCSAKSLNISGWDTSNGEDFVAAFAMHKIENLDISSVDMKNAKDYGMMFRCSSNNFKTIKLPKNYKARNDNLDEYGDFYGIKNCTLYYQGTMKDWENLGIKYDDTYFSKTINVVCSDGTIRASKDNADEDEIDKDKSETVDSKQKNTNVAKLKAGKKSITVSWKKQTKGGIKGYEIEYSTDKKFKKNAKRISVNKNKTTSKKIKKLTSKKKYYVRIRTYKKSGSKKIYSKWSKAKSIKVK